MADKCSIYAHCTNSKGEVVESRLFKDLLHYTSNNRELAKEYYGIGINPKFLEKVQGSAKFDENGEITFQSLRSLAKLNVDKDTLINTLNKDINSGIYDYEEAVNRLQSFNRNSQFNNEFMATITSTKDGRYNLSVVEKNPSNELALNQEISNRTLQDRIKYYLNKAGVSIEFIENDEKVNGRYSTKNAKKTADGLYQLIQVANGKNVTGVLAEEAGHFAIGALGNSPLVERLMRLLTPEVQKQIVGDEYDSKYLGESSRREIAGTLVGQAIAGNIDDRAPWQSLVKRIVNTAKRIFHSIKGDSIANAALEAERIADMIAKGFMSPNFTGSVEEAIKTKETLYNAPTSFNVKVFKQAVNRLKLQASEMKSISNTLFDKFNNIVGQVESGRNLNVPSSFADSIALEGITEAISLMSDLMVAEIPDMLASIDFDNVTDFNSNMPANAKALRVVRAFTRNALALIDLINSSTSNISGANRLLGDTRNVIITDSLGNRVSYNLLDITDKLNKLLTGRNGLINELKNKESQFFLKFLEGANYGNKYITRAARVIFNWKGRGNNKLIEYRDSEDIPISDLMNDLESDISLFERFLASMSNNSDVIGQLADKTVKLANKWADDMTIQAQDQLRVLQSRLKDIKLSNTDIFVERSNRDGTITGNIISAYCWGDYENDWLDFKKQSIEEFNQKYPNLDGKSDFEKALLWDNFFKPKAKIWHKGDATHIAHSQWDNQQQMYIPSSDYESEQYKRDIQPYPERVKWLNEYMQLKADLDSRLPEGSMPLHRMPQFKGTFSNKIRNRRLFENSSKATIHTVMTEMRDTFCEDSEDTDFGSQQTYNTIDEDMFHNQLAFEREKINRVPLYGVNKLKDPSELSTDLFYSTFAYAGMANSYAAMSQVVDTLEVGKEVLNRRTVEGINSEESRLKDKSRAYSRYLKFLDKQVYGIGVPKLKIGNKLVLNKLFGFLTGFAGKYFLGGNIAGGMVNVGTGSIEIFKEAFSGEYFDVKDWAKAHKSYYGSFMQNWWGYGKEFKEDKVSLMIRHFNMLSENRGNQRAWHTRDSRILNMFGESLFLPYKVGEHYMSSMSYLALANKIKLYDSNGNRISLFNAYKVVDVEDESGNADPKYGKTLKLEGTFFKSKEGIKEYNLIQSIIGQIDNVLSNPSPFGSVLNLSQEELDYINSKGYNLADMADVKTKLLEDSYKLTWTIDDESAFMDKAREINNRLHGIYNNQDKVAFQQNMFGNMLLAMRGYALGMLERRYGASKYNTILGGETEGSMRSLAKVIASTFTDRGGFGLTMRAILLPVSKKTKQAMLNAGFSANQYYNMRRNMGDAMFILALTLLKILTAKGGGDDDDKESEEEVDTTTGIVYYFTARLLREQSAMNTAWGMVDESQNLMSMIPVGVSGLIDISNLAYQFGGSLVADEDNSEFYYQSKKEGMYEKGDSKWEAKFWRMFPYLRSNYVWEHPYEAAKSYEYGRKVRN